MGLPLVLILIFLLQYSIIDAYKTSYQDILGLDIPIEPNLDPNTVCHTYPQLKGAQYSLCVKYPDVAASAIQGIQIAIHECQYQFKYHRWNCSMLEKKNKNPYSSAFMSQGYKESAFAHAISSAGVIIQVARACSLGKLAACGCHPVMDHTTNTWVWKGCDHNIEFSESFSKKFLDSKEKARDIHSKTNLHNIRLGRRVVLENIRTMCKCHGMSGSCEMKTCWKSAPPIRDIGNILKNKFWAASKVQMMNTNSANDRLRILKRRKKRKKKPSKTSLVYYERSPSFCEPDMKSDCSGTQGRYCNSTSTGIDNCETLCCGRGYYTLKMSRTERCQCRFHWCCYVICKECTISDWVTVCK